MSTKLTYVKSYYNSVYEDLQKILDHFWLGRLKEKPNTYVTLTSGNVIPIFLCNTTKGNYLVVKIDTRTSDLFNKNKRLLKAIEKDLELKFPRANPAHVANHYFYTYPTSKKSDSVLGGDTT